jgi:hypothetical protein
VGDQYKLEIIAVLLNKLEKSYVKKAGIDQDSLTAVIGTDQEGVTITG